MNRGKIKMEADIFIYYRYWRLTKNWMKNGEWRRTIIEVCAILPTIEDLCLKQRYFILFD